LTIKSFTEYLLDSFVNLKSRNLDKYFPSELAFSVLRVRTDPILIIKNTISKNVIYLHLPGLTTKAANNILNLATRTLISKVSYLTKYLSFFPTLVKRL